MDQHKKNFAIQTLRRATYKWHTRWAAEKRSKLGRNEYFCEDCGLICKKRESQMDHHIPVVDPVQGFTGFDDYIDRMYPSTPEGWRRLCKPCHSIKTKQENEIRKTNKK